MRGIDLAAINAVTVLGVLPNEDRAWNSTLNWFQPRADGVWTYIVSSDRL